MLPLTAHENAILDGMLTMHGVTRPVRFEVRMTMISSDHPDKAGEIVVTAKSFINRVDFEMDHLTFLVSDIVELCMRVEASLFRKQ